jgi:hypothetical protein
MPSEHKALTDTESCKTKTGDLALLFGVLLLFNYSNFCLPFGMLKSLIDRELLSGLLILLDF